MLKTAAFPAFFLVGALTVGVPGSGPDSTTSAQSPDTTPDMPGAASEPLVWNVDASHTEIGFTVKHFFTPVNGTFRSHDIELLFDPEDPSLSSVTVTIDVASVDTGNERRDRHLRSADFFDAESHPHMTFESTSVRRESAERFVAVGDLTIKGITREVELPITLLGVKKIPEGPMREMLGGVTRVASFEASTRLDRREFEVGVANWAQTVIVGGEVDVRIALEANRK